jgi:predicted outer membrane repeat protein
MDAGGCAPSEALPDPPTQLDAQTRAAASDLDISVNDWSFSLVESFLEGTGIAPGAATIGVTSPLAGRWTATLQNQDTGEIIRAQFVFEPNGALIQLDIFDDENVAPTELTFPSSVSDSAKGTATGALLGSRVETGDGVLFDVASVSAVDSTIDGQTVRSRIVFQFVMEIAADGGVLAGSGRQTSELVDSTDPNLSPGEIMTLEGSSDLRRNDSPVADAGADRSVVDEDGDGVEAVTLDASGSSDPDGELSDFRWFEGGDEIAAGQIVDVALPVGTHEITLVIADDDGAISSDIILVEVQSQTPPSPTPTPCPDNDDDGVCNEDDNCSDAGNADQIDSDADSLGDACDNCTSVNNEPQTNSDADTHGDACDNCPNIENESQDDGDQDGVGDECDGCADDPNKVESGICGCGVAESDSDDDGTLDCDDNCLNDSNEDQSDNDGDAVGDECDNCPTTPNIDQINIDGDSFGDACDNCLSVDNEPQTNSDADNHGDTCDNCPNTDNEDQADGDDDGVGDACDNCPDDPDKTEPGICGCGVAEGSCVVFVDVTAMGVNEGTSWTDAFTSLQDGLAAAGDSLDEIWVAKGTYRPDVGENQTQGDRSATFQLLNGVGVYGGFTGGETSRDQRDSATNATTLHGGSISYHVVTGSGTDASAIVDGFTITAGNANGSDPNDRGSGMYNDSGSPTVANCAFLTNSAGKGAMYNDQSGSMVTGCVFTGNQTWGMYNVQSTPTVDDCIFSLNQNGGMHNEQSTAAVSYCDFTLNSGSGMYNDPQSDSIVIDCDFIKNTSGNGGGMYNEQGSPTIVNCLFVGNNATSAGGGMRNDANSPLLINCIFSGNTADAEGGGIASVLTSSPLLRSCSFSDNSSGTDGGGIYSDGSAAIANCIFWNNSDSGGADESAQIHTAAGNPTVNHSCVQGGWTGLGGNNISSDPQFVDADGPDNAAGSDDDNLRLQTGSPCVGAGNNATVPADTLDLDDDGDTAEPKPLDLDGNPRIVDTTVDMGAYEHQG